MSWRHKWKHFSLRCLSGDTMIPGEETIHHQTVRRIKQLLSSKGLHSLLRYPLPSLFQCSFLTAANAAITAPIANPALDAITSLIVTKDMTLSTHFHLAYCPSSTSPRRTSTWRSQGGGSGQPFQRARSPGRQSP